MSDITWNDLSSDEKEILREAGIWPNDLLIETLQVRAEKAEAAYHASEQQFVALAQVLGVPYELNTQQDLVAMVKARLSIQEITEGALEAYQKVNQS